MGRLGRSHKYGYLALTAVIAFTSTVEAVEPDRFFVFHLFFLLLRFALHFVLLLSLALTLVGGKTNHEGAVSPADPTRKSATFAN